MYICKGLDWPQIIDHFGYDDDDQYLLDHAILNGLNDTLRTLEAIAKPLIRGEQAIMDQDAVKSLGLPLWSRGTYSAVFAMKLFLCLDHCEQSIMEGPHPSELWATGALPQDINPTVRTVGEALMFRTVFQNAAKHAPAPTKPVVGWADLMEALHVGPYEHIWWLEATLELPPDVWFRDLSGHIPPMEEFPWKEFVEKSRLPEPGEE